MVAITFISPQIIATCSYPFSPSTDWWASRLNYASLWALLDENATELSFPATRWVGLCREILFYSSGSGFWLQVVTGYFEGHVFPKWASAVTGYFYFLVSLSGFSLPPSSFFLELFQFGS